MLVKVLTLNAALMDIRILGRSVYCPIRWVESRLNALAVCLNEIDADIIFLQEVFSRKLQVRLYESISSSYPYVTGFTLPGLRFRLGNELLIISRFPLSVGKLTRFRSAAPEELRHTSKGFYHAKVSITDVADVELINFHATAGGAHAHPESDDMESIRTAQINQILEYTGQFQNIILGGDLNAGPHTSSYNYQQLLDAGFTDTFMVSGGDGFTWDPNNPLVSWGVEAHLPPQRIDHILVDQSLLNAVTPVMSEIVFDERTITTRTGPIPLSDHYGILTTLQFNK